ncbi:DNA/RNA endonuclease G [Microbacterium sp. SLBN-111]|uniref:DNA/RNA endonuclease G n=1 Tax=Microbacterium sp. SLBN-111 TaxID=3377733 RepID=UPI003C788BE3
MTDSVLRTVVRRETHSPRTGAMLVVVTLLVLAAVYAAVEIALSLAGRPPLLVTPGAAFDALAGLPSALVPAGQIAVGAVIALVGLIVLVIAVAPGRLSRHEMAWGERAVVVDNGVVASALAQHLSLSSGIARENVVVGVAHRTVDVTVRPPLGIPVDADRLRQIVEDEVATYHLSPSVRTHVRVERPADAEKENSR